MQAPDNCSSIVAITASGSFPRYGLTTRSLYSCAAVSGSKFATCRFGTLGISLGLFVSSISNTSCKLEAGSVLINKTCFPISANVIAVAHAVDVFPTPPLPVKNKNGVNAIVFGLYKFVIAFHFFLYFFTFNFKRTTGF